MPKTDCVCISPDMTCKYTKLCDNRVCLLLRVRRVRIHLLASTSTSSSPAIVALRLLSCKCVSATSTTHPAIILPDSACHVGGSARDFEKRYFYNFAHHASVFAESDYWTPQATIPAFLCAAFWSEPPPPFLFFLMNFLTNIIWTACLSRMNGLTHVPRNWRLFF